MRLRTCSLLAVLLGAAAAAAAQPAERECTACHLPDVQAPISALHASAHWNTDNPNSPVNAGGCQACHGASVKHLAAPTKMQPDVSFGPRWSSSIEAQNAPCLTCHEANAAGGWATGVHAEENLTCSNCHNSHVDDDAQRLSGRQGEYCVVCHKLQKDGMHNLAATSASSPACTNCHDPHADPHAELAMLTNRSAGCRNCHDLQAMMTTAGVSPRALSYHKVMESPDRTCIDCHRGVAHVDRDDFARVLAGGFTSHPINLFYPGQTDTDFLLGEHPGAQSLRQGRNCRQCHIGEARAMGENLAPAGITAALPVELSFARRGERMDVTVSWEGGGNANSVAVMFSGEEVEDFARGGCWAACHSDLPGMTRDRGQGVAKYLRASRAQARSVGRPPIVHDQQTLDGMISSGAYVELWRAELDQGGLGALTVSRLLERPNPVANPTVTATARFAGGRWTVTFSRAVDDPLKPLVAGRAYTLGVAVHGDGKSGADHWVSLPLTVSLDGFDTDFVAAQ